MELEIPEDSVRQKTFRSFFSKHWKGFVVFFVPLLCLPILFIYYFGAIAYGCMYLIAVMAIFWVTEALPLYITSMLPIVAFPLMGIMSSDKTCGLYLNDTVVMIMGGIIVALAIEYCNLHKRIALRIIQLVGYRPRRLHFGLILVTMFLSMWISNAVCTAMMCPITQAVLEELQAQGVCKITQEPQNRNVDKKTTEEEAPYPSKITTCFYLGIAYASSLGGFGTLIGTTTNLTLKKIYDNFFPTSTESLTSPAFMLYSVPLMLVFTGLTYLYLQWHFMGLFRPKSKEAEEIKAGESGAAVAKIIIDQRYKKLGPMTAHEIQVMLLAIFMLVMNATHHPGILPGWSEFLQRNNVYNALPTIFVVILCFMLPVNYEFLRYCTGRRPLPATTTPSLITWKFIQSKVPWGLIFLLGSGFALAQGTIISGVAHLIGNALTGLGKLHHAILLFAIICVTVLLTAFSTNVNTANILVSVLAEMSLHLEIHPLYLILPTGLASSIAFLLPVSSPSNALVSAYANIRTKDMAIAGIGPTIITIVALFILSQTWGLVVYPNLHSFPEWARIEALHRF